VEARLVLERVELHGRNGALTMSTITIPDGHVAVVVFVPRAEDAESVVKVVGITDEDSEHGCIAEAICALAAAACEISDDLIEEMEEEDPAPGAGEGEVGGEGEEEPA
jgi:hypothetical protein